MEALSPDQIRVLGALIEKEQTTPEQYPLTLNALVTACNQTSNRNPVSEYTPGQVSEIVAGLRPLHLARVVHSPGQRADKYRQVMHEALGLTDAELAVLAVLMLRGPQTVSELLTRTDRYADLGELGGVEGVLHRLRNRYDEPWVVRLERQPGQRDPRWAHLLAGDVLVVPAEAPGGSRGPGSGERLGALAGDVAALRAELAEVRSEVEGLRADAAKAAADLAEVRALLD
jgi:uncharacterized protein YceH (UPF0502 family)